MSVWFVTGAARGLGANVVTAALAAGHRVVAAARRPDAVARRFPDAGDSVLPVALDVTDEAAAHAAAAAAVDAFGRIDVLVNNAGRGLLGAVEELPDDAVRAVYETNVFGTLNVLRAVLPAMREQRSGHVVNISSIGGFTGSAGWGVYNSTKFALEGISEALAREVAPLGIVVTIVEPGYFRTDFLDGSSLHIGAGSIADYADGPVAAMRQRAADVNHAQPGDPAKAAAAIVAVVDSPEPPLRIQLGRDSFDAIAAKTAFVAKEQAAWREVSLSTDRDDVG